DTWGNVWEVKSGDLRFRVPWSPGVQYLFAADGSRLAVSTPTALMFIDLSSGQEDRNSRVSWNSGISKTFAEMRVQQLAGRSNVFLGQVSWAEKSPQWQQFVNKSLGVELFDDFRRRELFVLLDESNGQTIARGQSLVPGSTADGQHLLSCDAQ